MKQEQSHKAHCPDNCMYLASHYLCGGFCMGLQGKQLSDYSVNAMLVKFICDPKCPIEEGILPGEIDDNFKTSKI